MVSWLVGVMFVERVKIVVKTFKLLMTLHYFVFVEQSSTNAQFPYQLGAGIWAVFLFQVPDQVEMFNQRLFSPGP